MDDWPIIFSYTRAQEIADGVLVDVTTQAAEVGFKVHTVVTNHLYNRYVAPPAGLEGEGQSVEGRIHAGLLRLPRPRLDLSGFPPQAESLSMPQISKAH